MKQGVPRLSLLETPVGVLHRAGCLAWVFAYSRFGVLLSLFCLFVDWSKYSPVPLCQLKTKKQYSCLGPQGGHIVSILTLQLYAQAGPVLLLGVAAFHWAHLVLPRENKPEVTG